MEEGQSVPEKQDQAEEEEQQQQGATQHAGGTTTTTTAAAVRSYECNFCKRGFTNAQALGGHMNIHRKDKAKLKQSSTSSNPDPPTPQPPNFPPSTFFPPPANIFHNPSTDHQKLGNWPFPSSKDTLNSDITPSRDQITTSKSSIHDQQGKVPLPLMIGDIQVAPRRADIQNPLPAAEPELDLELRLGHNIAPSSDHSSSTDTTMGTRKFF